MAATDTTITAIDGRRAGVRRRARLRAVFLSNNPSSGKALPVLDGVRALAVIGIFLRHSWGLSGSAWVVVPVPGGDVDLSPFVVMMSNGVDLFFVLSGFLLARAFIEADLLNRPRPSHATYFRHRAFRILPAYYVVLAALLVFFVPTVLAEDLVYSVAGLKTVLSHLVVMQTVFPWSYGLWGPGSPFWTLTIEVIFYLAVPWLARFFFRNRWRWALPLSALITFGWLWFARSSAAEPLASFIVDHGGRVGATEGFARFFLSKQFPAHLFDFAVGMTVANWWVQARHGRPSYPARLLATRTGAAVTLVVGVAVVLVAMRQLGVSTLTNSYFDGLQLMASDNSSALIFYYLEEPSMAVGFGLIIAALAIGGGRLAAPLSIAPLRLVGIVGYSIYLWHMPFLYMHAPMSWMTSLSPAGHWVALMAFTGAIVFGLSLLTYVFVERPFISMGRRRRVMPTTSVPVLGMPTISEPVARRDPAPVAD